jgi:hypothetical protein
MIILNITLLISLILIVFFKTEAWVEYCKLLQLDGISQYKDYELKKSNDLSLDYIQYLRQYHDCFLIRLITCPICLSIWLSIIAGTIILSFSLIPIFIVGSLLLYSIINK